MSRADREWLLTAAVAVTLTWIAATCSQVGASVTPLPPGRVLATQVAGSFVNHVLPAGVGIAALNLRMLRRCGLTMPRAAGAAGLNVAAGFIVHIVALAGLLLFAHPQMGRLKPSHLLVVAAGVAAAALTGVLITWTVVARRRGPAAERIQLTLAAGRLAMRQPRRAVPLWAGSAAVPALHIVVLTSVLHALHRPAPLLTIAVVYLGATALAAAIPSPGGFGGLDVTLLAALTGVGMTPAAAASAVVGYRLLTVWIPLLPGAATLILILRRRIV